MASVLKESFSGRLKKNLINSGYYLGGSIVQFVIAVVSQPIFARYLELDDFATIGYFNAISAIIAPMYSLTLTFYYMANYWRQGNSKENLSLIVNYLNILNVIVAILSLIIVKIYFGSYNIVFPFTPFIYIVLLNLFLEKFKTYYLLECRIERNGFKYFWVSVVQIVLNVLLSFLFVIYLKGGAAGKMFGGLASSLLVGILVIVLFYKEGKYRFMFVINKLKLKELLKFALPLTFAAYAYLPINTIDQILLERQGNIQEYGYYSIALTITGIMNAFFVAFYQGFEPDLFKFITEGEYKKYLRYCSIYLLGMIFSTVLFVFFAPIIFNYLTAGRYNYASTYSAYLVVAMLLLHIGGISEQLFVALNKTKLVLLRNLFTGVFCILLTIFMIEHFGYIGAAYSRILVGAFSIIVGFGLFYIYGLKNMTHGNSQKN